MSEQSEGKQVPLTELMLSVPANARLELETDFADDGRCIGHRMIPVGRYMHEAADRIAQLERELAEEKALSDFRHVQACEFQRQLEISERQSDLALAEARREGLREALKIAENYEDVEDRSDGTQQANLAMTICTELRDRIDAAISGNQPHTGD
jgi:hypothetical protein